MASLLSAIAALTVLHVVYSRPAYLLVEPADLLASLQEVEMAEQQRRYENLAKAMAQEQETAEAEKFHFGHAFKKFKEYGKKGLQYVGKARDIATVVTGRDPLTGLPVQQPAYGAPAQVMYDRYNLAGIQANAWPAYRLAQLLQE